MSLNKDMGDAHERHFAQVLAMRQPRGSGNQWRDPMDARHNHLDTEFAYACDGKSTLKKSIGFTLAGWQKAVLQAGAERPAMPLRFYADGSLKVAADLIVCGLDDFAEMHEAAESWAQMRKLLEKLVQHRPVSARTTTLGGLAQLLVVVDEINDLLKTKGEA